MLSTIAAAIPPSLLKLVRKTMLSELIYEGSVTGQRILEVEGGIPKLETSVSRSGRFETEKVSVDITEIWTYWSIQKRDGSLYSEDKGVLTTKDGTEVATATGIGIGRISNTGKSRYAGANFHRTNSNGKLAFLNNIIAVRV
jgi:hypothetical protein